MYYEVDKNKSYIFFQAVNADAILHTTFFYCWADRKNGYLIAVEMERIMREEKKSMMALRPRQGNLGLIFRLFKSHVRQIIHVSCLADPRMTLESSENLPEISLDQHNYDNFLRDIMDV